MKKLFSTPKRAVTSTLCIVAVVLIAAAGAVLLGNGLISKAEAKAVALADAGLDEADVSALRARLELDDGRFLYEVDFYNDGAEYEYQIQARDGDIISRDIDGGPVVQNIPAGVQGAASGVQDMVVQEETASAASEEPATAAPETAVQEEPAVGASAAAGGGTDNAGGDIGADRAKAAALAHAQLNEGDVRFVKTELDHDDGRAEYEVEFYYGKLEYSYTIDAVTGSILEYDVDRD